MKTYIVQLDDHDDVISARDKISWSKARRILLVWPQKARVLERRVDLLLLKRHSQQLGAQLALVTRSSLVRVQAVELGIPVFTDAVEAQHANWRRTRGRRKYPRQKLQRPTTSPADFREQRLAERRASQDDLFSRLGANRWVRLGVFTFSVLAFLLMMLAFLPGAEIHLKPYRQQQQLTIAVWASPAVRAPSASGGMPAQTEVVTVEGRDQASSTGQASIPDRYATGQVLFTNLTDRAVEIPEGSVLLGITSPQVDFMTTQAVQVPAGTGKSVMVGARALLPGSSGNLPAGKIQALQGPGGLSLAVNNPSATFGGSDQAGKLPTEQDYRALRKKLLENLQASAVEEMRARIKPDQRLLEGTIHLKSTVSEIREPPQGQPGDQLQLTLRIEYEAMIIDEADLQAVAQSALDANRKDDFDPVPGSLNITNASEPQLDLTASASEAGGSLENQTARWSFRIERVLEARWNKTAVIRLIQGKGVSEAQKALEAKFRLAEAPLINLYPPWWGRLPFLPARIKVVTE
jgi:hypothetical protein